MFKYNDWPMLLLSQVTKEEKKVYGIFEEFKPNFPSPIYKEEVFQDLNMLSSRFFSRTSLALSKRNFSTSIFNMAPQHRQVAVIGSGPAGHTAAIYLARANLNPIMFEGMMANGFAPGGQLTTTTDVENYPGFPKGVLGGELMDLMRAQSENCGTVIETETITKLDTSSRPFKIWREGFEDQEEPTDTADAVVIATGASARRMNLPGEEKYWQNGISACAVCDGAVPIFRNKPLVVIGGGDSAAEEAIYLTKCMYNILCGPNNYGKTKNWKEKNINKIWGEGFKERIWIKRERERELKSLVEPCN
ncbi:unnamed protein product [Mucor hiemalis]